MIGERSNKLLSQFVVLFQNILVLSGGQDLCMASDVITNMSYKPSYIDRQRIFNALMLYSTIRIIKPIFFKEVDKKTCRELGFRNDLTKSKHRERLDQEFGHDKNSPC